MGEPHTGPLVRHGALREILDGCAQLRERVLPDDLGRSAQCEQMELETSPLELQQLMENERLGQTREAVDQDGEVRRTRLASHLLIYRPGRAND